MIKPNDAVKGIIFDLDGTLVDTLGDLHASLNHALGVRGHKKISPQKCRDYVGHGMQNLVRRALDGQQDDLEDTLKVFKDYYRLHLLDFTKPYPGIPALLSQIPQEISLGVLSNKAEEMVKIIVDALFSDIPWKVVTGKREGYPHKPDPRSLLALCDHMDIDPSKVIYVGDSEVDCQTAQNAGCQPWAVSWGFRERRVLEKEKPLQIFDSVEDLCTAILNL
jgi:phosphoglycolate phosphatase